MNAALLDLYSDFLILNDRYATATGISSMTGNVISHDKITRFLSEEEYGDKEGWAIIKRTVRKIEDDQGVFIADDTISEKPYMDENEIVGWYFDHSKGRSVKGINIVSVLYEAQGMSIPLSVQIVYKNEEGKPRVGKNGLFRQSILQGIHNRTKFRYGLADVWFGSTENMEFIKETHKKDFIFPVKANRQVALSEAQHHRIFLPACMLSLKLELMKIKLNMNHYATKTVLVTVALKAAFEKNRRT